MRSSRSIICPRVVARLLSRVEAGIAPELSLDDEEVLLHFARAVAVSSLSSLIRSSHGERRGSGTRSDVSPVSYGLETGWLAAEFLGSTLETSWLARNRSF
jgi:hypothetical protein